MKSGAAQAAPAAQSPAAMHFRQGRAALLNTEPISARDQFPIL